MISKYAFAGGVVRPDQIYVPRAVDGEITDLFLTDRQIVNLVAPRQSGKSSISKRITNALQNESQVSCEVCFRNKIGEVNKSNNTREKFFGMLFRAIGKELGILAADVNAWMVNGLGDNPVDKVADFFAVFLREHKREPIVFVFDEIDFVAPHGNHTDIFFEALRVLHSELDKLDFSFLLMGIQHPAQLMKSGVGSFNIGVDKTLEDFDYKDDEVVSTWADGLPNADDPFGISKQIIKVTGGHPFLTSVLHHDFIERAASSAIEVQELVSGLLSDAKAERRHTSTWSTPSEIISMSHAVALESLNAYRKIISEETKGTRWNHRAISTLKTAGLIKVEEGVPVPRNHIFATYFGQEWVDVELADFGIGYRERAKARVNKDEPRPKICLINTGGTLGMERQDDGTLAPPTDLRRFFQSVPELDEIAEIEPLPLMCKDGINVSPEDWRSLAEAIYNRRSSELGFSAFVVCHGTDTLAYTASAVAFSFGKSLHVPIVFTGSQAPIDVLHGDAKPNLIRATKIAAKLAQERVAEVCIAYNDKCFRAVRSQKADDFRFEGFVSPTISPIAIVTEHVDIDFSVAARRDDSVRTRLAARFENKIVKFSVFPGLDPEQTRRSALAEGVQGIVFETPGVGNIPENLIPIIAEATNSGIPVLITSLFPVKPETRNQYIPANAPIEAGAIPAGNMTDSAAVVKFMWVLGETQRALEAGEINETDKLLEITELMATDFVGEVDLGTTLQETKTGTLGRLKGEEQWKIRAF